MTEFYWIYSESNKLNAKNTKSKNTRVKKFLCFTLKTLILSLLISCTATEVHVLRETVSSFDEPATFQLSSQHISPFISAFSEPVLLFEYIFSYDDNSPELIGKFDFLSSPSLNSNLEINVTSDAAILEISFDDASSIFRIHQSQKRFLTSRHHFSLIFGGQFSPTRDSLDISFFFFENSASNDPPLPQVHPICTGLSVDSHDILSIHLSKSSRHHTLLKNLTLIDGWPILENHPIENLFLGVAQLHNAVFFHLEPAHSKFLFSRSGLNLPGMRNGSEDGSLGNVTSFFSDRSGHTEWLFFTNNHEFFYWENAFLLPVEASSLTFLFNFSLYLRTTLEQYLNAPDSANLPVLAFLDSSGNVLMLVLLHFINFNQNLGEISFSLDFFDSADFLIFSFEISEIIDSPLLLLFPDSLKISLIPQGASSTLMHVSLGASDPSSRRTSQLLSVADPFLLENISRIVLGSHMPDPALKNPKFLISPHDFQIFHGGFFLQSQSDPLLLESLSQSRSHHVSCRSNPYLLRFSFDSLLDQFFHHLLATLPSCKERTINYACAVPNCELCAGELCLVCQIPFLLQNGQCIDRSSDLEKLDFGVFSRTSPIPLQPVTALVTATLSPNIPFDFASSKKIILGRLAYEVSTSIPQETLQLTFANETLFAPNPSVLAAPLNNFLFSGSSPTFIYFIFESKLPLISFVSSQSGQLELIELSISCETLPNDLQLKSFLRALYCPESKANFSSLQPLSRATLGSGSSTFTASSSVFSDFIFPCKNNCQCNDSFSNLACSDSCASSRFLALTSNTPKVSSCVACPQHCQSCLDSICLSCASDHFEVSSFALEQFPNLTFRECQKCHFLCPLGCDGPLSADCLFCPLNCLFCQDSSSCLCDVSRGQLFSGFDPVFGVCMKSACPQKCEICDDSQNCLKCKFNHHWLGAECVPIDTRSAGHCVHFRNQKCIKCAERYHLQNSFCRRCPSNCVKCAKSVTGTICLQCDKSYNLTSDFRCYRMSRPLNSICSAHPLKCRPVIPGSKQPQSDCIQSFNYNRKLKKCVKCKDHLCPVCSPNIPHGAADIQYSLHCKICKIQNCEKCLSQNACFKCEKGYFLDPTNPGNCRKCSIGCQTCRSLSKCEKCHIEYSLLTKEDGSSRCKCSNSFILNPKTDSCVSCDTCDDCQSAECTFCAKCKSECSWSLKRISRNYFGIASNDLVFNIQNRANLNIFENQTYNFDKTHFYVISGQMVIFISNLSTRQRIQIPKKSYQSKTCSLETLSLDFVPEHPPSESLSSSDWPNHLSYIKKFLVVMLFIWFLFRHQYNIQSIAMILVFRELNAFSFMYKQSREGLTGFINHRLAQDNFNSNWDPLDDSQKAYSLVRNSEHLIPTQLLVGFFFFMISGFISLMTVISFCRFSTKKNSSVDSILKHKMNMNDDAKSNSSLDNPKKQQISSMLSKHIQRYKSCKILLSRLADWLKRNKPILLVHFHTCMTVTLCHAAAKSMRMLRLFSESMALWLVVLIYHFFLVYFFQVSFNNLSELKKRMPEFVQMKKLQKVRQFVLLKKNLVLLLFTNCSCYLMVLLANNVHFVITFLVLKISFTVSVFLSNMIFDKREIKCLILFVPYNILFGFLLSSIIFKSPQFVALQDLFSFLIYLILIVSIFIPKFFMHEKTWIKIVCLIYAQDSRSNKCK